MNVERRLQAGLVVAAALLALTVLARPGHAAPARAAVAAPAQGTVWSLNGVAARIEARLRPILGWLTGGGEHGGVRPAATAPDGGAGGSSSGSSGGSTDEYPTADPNG